MPKCKSHTVYIYEVLAHNGGIDKMSLAEKLVTLRKQKGLTQMDLAERLNVSRQAISRWEVGAAVPSTDNLKVLGELYGVPVDYLLNDDTTEAIQSTREAEENPEDKVPDQKRVKYKLFLICVVVIVIAAVILICALVPRNQNQDQVIPMEDMCTGPDEDYSEGTFTIK